MNSINIMTIQNYDMQGQEKKRETEKPEILHIQCSAQTTCM